MHCENLYRQRPWSQSTPGHFLEGVPVMVTIISAFASYLHLLTGARLVSHGVAVITLHWTGLELKNIREAPAYGHFSSVVEGIT